MCMCRLSDFDESETITVTPLRSFPVIRDLVTDVTFNYEKAAELPSFSPPPRDEDGKRRMAQIDVERGQEFRKCIECFLCQNVCHVVRDHEDNKKAFAGPRFFLRYAELDMHPLDTNDRRELAQGAAGIGMCNITKCCTEVCPEGIKITDNAIIPMKERVVDKKYDPLVWLGATIGLRNKDNDGRKVAPGSGQRARAAGDPASAGPDGAGRRDPAPAGGAVRARPGPGLARARHPVDPDRERAVRPARHRPRPRRSGRQRRSRSEGAPPGDHRRAHRLHRSPAERHRRDGVDPGLRLRARGLTGYRGARPAIASSRWMRSAMGGWVLNSLAAPAPRNGLAIIMWLALTSCGVCGSG